MYGLPEKNEYCNSSQLIIRLIMGKVRLKKIKLQNV